MIYLCPRPWKGHPVSQTRERAAVVGAGVAVAPGVLSLLSGGLAECLPLLSPPSTLQLCSLDLKLNATHSNYGTSTSTSLQCGFRASRALLPTPGGSGRSFLKLWATAPCCGRENCSNGKRFLKLRDQNWVQDQTCGRVKARRAIFPRVASHGFTAEHMTRTLWPV